MCNLLAQCQPRIKIIKAEIYHRERIVKKLACESKVRTALRFATNLEYFRSTRMLDCLRITIATSSFMF